MSLVITIRLIFIAIAASIAAVIVTALVLPLVAAVLGAVPWRYTARNLVIRWKTTVMTAMAFTLVVALMVVMLAFVNGMVELTQASGHPENVIILSDGATDELFSNLKTSDISDIDNQRGIAAGPDGQTLVSREVYLIVNQAVTNPLPGKPARRFLQLRGIDNPVVAGRVHGLSLYDGGKWFSPAGVQMLDGQAEVGKEDSAARSAVQAVLGEGIANELGRNRPADQRAAARNPDRLEPGDTFELNRRTWIVVGILQSAGSTFDSEIWAKSAIVGPMFGKEIFTSVVARAPDAAGAQRLKDFFTNEFKKTALQAQVETEYFKSLGNTSQQFLISIVFVTIIMSIGGIFGVMNTMFAAISQRTKDIGVLRLLGYARWQILAAFLLEAQMISLLGGATGCVLGSLVDGVTATSVVSSGPGGGKLVVFKMIVSGQILLIGMLASLAMGCLGGFVPSLSAVRLRPLEALR